MSALTSSPLLERFHIKHIEHTKSGTRKGAALIYSLLSSDESLSFLKYIVEGKDSHNRLYRTDPLKAFTRLKKDTSWLRSVPYKPRYHQYGSRMG